MNTYRIKHLPTGLYYRPSRELYVKGNNPIGKYVKYNLSKVGKVYNKKPTLDWLGGATFTAPGVLEKVNPADWQIVKMEVTESPA
jgi:hypothetical protein